MAYSPSRNPFFTSLRLLEERFLFFPPLLVSTQGKLFYVAPPFSLPLSNLLPPGFRVLRVKDLRFVFQSGFLLFFPRTIFFPFRSLKRTPLFFPFFSSRDGKGQGHTLTLSTPYFLPPLSDLLFLFAREPLFSCPRKQLSVLSPPFLSFIITFPLLQRVSVKSLPPFIHEKNRFQAPFFPPPLLFHPFRQRRRSAPPPPLLTEKVEIPFPLSLPKAPSPGLSGTDRQIFPPLLFPTYLKTYDTLPYPSFSSLPPFFFSER